MSFLSFLGLMEVSLLCLIKMSSSGVTQGSGDIKDGSRGQAAG